MSVRPLYLCAVCDRYYMIVCVENGNVQRLFVMHDTNCHESRRLKLQKNYSLTQW